MKKKVLFLIVSTLMIFSLGACGEPKMSEEAAAVQRKIDKALESTPTYADYVEIRTLYGDLLNEEQGMIQNYNQIEEKFALNEQDIAAIFAVNDFKNHLKNPNSLELIGIDITKDPLDTYHVRIEYSAENAIGGRVEDTYYVSVEIPTYDAGKDEWSCELDSMYSLKQLGELLGTDIGREGDAKYYSYGKYMDYQDTAIKLDTTKIMDNLDYPIIEVTE